MLNLRRFGTSEYLGSNSDTQYSSHVSVRFRGPSDSLGNIGGPLDHSQSDWLHEEDDDIETAEFVVVQPNALDINSFQGVAGSFRAQDQVDVSDDVPFTGVGVFNH